MSDWVEKPLCHLVEFEIGGTPSRDVPEYWADTNGGGHPWVSIADLRAGRVVETSERITDLGARNSNVKLVKQGTLMMTFKLTIGEVAMAGCDLFTNEAIAAISPKSKELSSDYLFHALPGAAKSAVSDAAIKGATLNKKKLGKIVVRFPLDEDCQLAIVSILRAIDTQIEATGSLIAKQERVRAGLMQDLFTRGVDEHGQLRPPPEEAPHLYHQTELGWLPKGWEAPELECFLAPISTPMRSGPKCPSET
jgi:type I restriction enzyme S subunit